MNYKAITLREDIKIEKLVTVHYFEFTKEHFFETEKHDFWELAFVDKGEAIAVAGKRRVAMKSGDIIFHKPNEPHSIIANGVDAPNIIVVSFVCNSKAMKIFERKIRRATVSQQWLLARIIEEAEMVFDTPLGDPYVDCMIKKKKTPVGSEQLIKLYLTELLLSFISPVKNNNPEVRVVHDDDFNRIVNYMEENITSKIKIKELSTEFNISPSTLKQIFTKNAHKGVIAYFIDMKIALAKKYIREGRYSMTQISEMLGYDQVNYFSYQFKKETRMTPTEYERSIRALQGRKTHDNE